MSYTPLLLEDSIKIYLGILNSRSAGYSKDVQVTLDGLVDIVGNLQMRNLTNKQFTKVFDRWRVINKPGTYNKKLGHVQTFLDYASRRGQIKVHPRLLLEGVQSLRVIPRKKVYLTAEQLLEVLDRAPHPRDRAYLALAMNTALRAGEMLSLRVGDLDLDGGDLYVLRHKTGTRDIMPVTADLDVEMRRWLTFYAERHNIQPTDFLTPAKEPPHVGRDGITTEERLACPLRPTVAMHYASGRQVLRDILSDMGVPTDQEGLHTIRRSIARLHYEHLLGDGEARDEALSIVQAMLGHSTQSVTEKYIGVERFKEARDRAMRGRRFLTAMTAAPDNVRRIHR